MSVKYPYLKDADFLMSSASQQNIEQFVKITILNFNEKPIQSIEGMVTTGSINLDGNSSMRRTANLTVFIDSDNADYMKVEGGLFALNKKVQIEIGISNTTDKYSNFPILWFPQGIFVIMGINITHSNTGLSISLQLKDKMVFLNGECGGTISAATVFHEYEVLNPSTGEYEISKPAIIQIIRELVNHFGNEQLGKIIINDIDPRIKRVMKWLQPYALYYTPGASGSQPNYSLSQPQTDDYVVFENDIKTKLQITSPKSRETLRSQTISINIKASEVEEGCTCKIQIASDNIFYNLLTEVSQDITSEDISISTTVEREGQVYIRARAEKNNLGGDWSEFVCFNIYTISMESPDTTFLEEYLTSEDLFDDSIDLIETTVQDKSAVGVSEGAFYLEFNKDIKLPEEYELDENGYVNLGVVIGFRKELK